MRRIEPLSTAPPAGTVSPTPPTLKRELGPWMSTALVVGNMIGSGVFLLPAALAAVMVVHGSSSLLAWAFTGVGAMLLALVFATLGRAYPRTGGPYAYAHRAFGEMVGFLNAAYRDDPDVDVVAFTATQIPFISDRTYPPEVAGAGYPLGIPIYPEEDLTRLIQRFAPGTRCATTLVRRTSGWRTSS